MSDRLARILGAPGQGRRVQGAHAREAPGRPVPDTARPASLFVVPEPRSETPVSLADLVPRRIATASVLVAALDEDVRFLLRRRCEMSAHLHVVGEAEGPVSSIRAAARLQPDLIVVQVRSTRESDAELITAFKELAPGSKVFAYSTVPGGAAVSAAMTAGADRYALAGAPLSALMREIEDLVASGEVQGSNR